MLPDQLFPVLKCTTKQWYIGFLLATTAIVTFLIFKAYPAAMQILEIL